MSGQSSQRARRIASPSTKQGPMKATLTFGLVQGSPTRAINARKNSPSSSPTTLWPVEAHRVKVRRSPDNRASPERASPCSPAFKVEHPKPVRLSPSSAIKRTGSLDTIAGPYLTGQWPRCDVTTVGSVPTLPSQPQDKSTQTPEWDVEDGFESRKRLSIHKRSSSLTNMDSIKDVRVLATPPPEPKSAFKIIKTRLSKTKEGSRITSATAAAASAAQHSSPVQGHQLSHANSTQTGPVHFQSKAVTIPVTHIPKARMRGSVEGPNQEIERALRSISGVDGEELQRASVGWLQTTDEPTPDGHRAPISELITRTTQTPSAYLDALRISDPPTRHSTAGTGSMQGHNQAAVVVGQARGLIYGVGDGMGEKQEEERDEEDDEEETSDDATLEARRGSPGRRPPIHPPPPSSSASSSASSRGSPAEYGLIPGAMDTSRPSSRDEVSPAEGCQSPTVTKESLLSGDQDRCLEADSPRESLLKCVPSPRPNKSFSFAREPPDGCEKVKLIEEPRSAPPVKEPLLYCPIQKSSQYHIPSVGSAFCPLYKTYITHQTTAATIVSPGGDAQ